jgi:apolipoprotein N-acyltransferase
MEIAMQWLKQFPIRFPALTAIFLGLVSSLGFAPFGQFWITFLAFTALFALLIKTDNLKTLLKIGYGFGWGHFFISCVWIPQTFTYQDVMPHWYGWPALALLSAYLAIYPMASIAAAGWLTQRINGQYRAPILVFALSGTWIIGEMLRATLFTGFAWNPLGIAMVDFAGHSTILGSYGLSGVLVLTSGAIWLLTRKNFILGGTGLAAALLFWISGVHIEVTRPIDNEKRPRVTIVQPNIGQDVDWQDPAILARNRETLLRLSRDDRPRPQDSKRIIFWSESAISDTLEDGYPSYFAAPDEALLNRITLARLLGPDDLLITGGLKYEFAHSPALNRKRLSAARNSVFAINSSAEIIGSYDKAHLVPYGEYLPFKPLLDAIGLAQLTQNTVPFIPGPGPDNIDLGPLGKAGIMVCYEVIFSGQTVNQKTRPDFLFNPSTDAWFGYYGPPQQLAQARLRAIEEGLPIIRTTPTGISAIIDGHGHVRGKIPWSKQGRLDGDLPPPLPPTTFSQYGNILPLALAIILILIAVAIGARRR